MALLDTFRAVTATEASSAHPHRSDNRKKLRWLVQNPPADGAKRMMITPDMSEAMMERNTDEEWHNRPHSRRGLRRYVEAMKRGWKYTGEPIIFSKSGRLLNGQHRLMASIESGMAFECLVVFGIDDDAFKFMDIGIARTAAHVFDIENIPNATQIAAGARLLFGYYAKQAWDGRAPEVENDVLLEFYYQHEDLQDALTPARELYKEGLVPFRWATFLYYICAAKNRKQATEFFSQIATGIGITDKETPAYRLRKKLNDNARSTSEKLNETLIGAYFIQAWNAHRRGERRGLFRWRTEQNPNESFPRAE